MKKRIVALMLGLTMFATAVIGCGDQSEQGDEVQDQTEDVSDAEEKEGEEKEAKEKDVAEDLFAEEVHLVYVLPQASDTLPGIDAIEEGLNKITKEKINATIEFEFIPIAEYTDKMNMKFTSGEEFDLCFTGAWNPYLQAVTKGAYAELEEEVLNTYAPEYMAQLNSAAWDAVKVDGKIYGCPIEQIYVRQTGIYVNTDIADKYNFDYSSIESLDDLDEILASLKEGEPDVVPYYCTAATWPNFVSYFGWDVIVDAKVPGIVYAEGDTQVINQFESEEFKAFCEKMREWYLAGYIPSDAFTGATSVEGKPHAFDSLAATKPGGDITESQVKGYTVKAVGIGNAAMTTSAINATITAVSATSENVERAVAFINLLNTDAEVLNLICHGIEGIDYEFIDEQNKVIQSISDYPGTYSFLVGNVFNEYYADSAMVGTWEETAEINAAAKASSILGFTFDSEPVATQIAQCTAVAAEHLPALTTGAIDVEDGIGAFLEALEQAGAADIIAEMQSQVDAWAAK